MICNLGDPMSLRHPVYLIYTYNCFAWYLYSRGSFHVFHITITSVIFYVFPYYMYFTSPWNTYIICMWNTYHIIYVFHIHIIYVFHVMWNTYNITSPFYVFHITITSLIFYVFHITIHYMYFTSPCEIHIFTWWNIVLMWNIYIISISHHQEMKYI